MKSGWAKGDQAEDAYADEIVEKLYLVNALIMEMGMSNHDALVMISTMHEKLFIDVYAVAKRHGEEASAKDWIGDRLSRFRKGVLAQCK